MSKLKKVLVVADLEQLSQLPYVRAILAESLRMYPQPPILIRRALNDDVLPTPLGGDPKGYPIGKGADIFISVWNLHRYSTQNSLPYLGFMHVTAATCKKQAELTLVLSVHC